MKPVLARSAGRDRYGDARVSTRAAPEGQYDPLTTARVVAKNIIIEKISAKLAPRPKLDQLLARLQSEDLVTVTGDTASAVTISTAPSTYVRYGFKLALMQHNGIDRTHQHLAAPIPVLVRLDRVFTARPRTVVGRTLRVRAYGLPVAGEVRGELLSWWQLAVGGWYGLTRFTVVSPNGRVHLNLEQLVPAESLRRDDDI